MEEFQLCGWGGGEMGQQESSGLTHNIKWFEVVRSGADTPVRSRKLFLFSHGYSSGWE